ncbi:hypothetical protein LZ023_40710 (plasmid) [Pseudomonas silvicola]|nr:hypothetical protein LZ023_40985 [Pseudomonas silvicola]WAH62257.1 hypothetical protein LZ023_40710 [Pseudomonas silvicola]
MHFEFGVLPVYRGAWRMIEPRLQRAISILWLCPGEIAMIIPDEAKAAELQAWHELLADEKAARNIPESQHGALRKHAEVLHRLGVIDDSELIELNELADARYADAAEAFLDRES